MTTISTPPNDGRTELPPVWRKAFPEDIELEWIARLQRRAVPFLVFLSFLHAALYAFLTPIWQAPDEPQHVHFVLTVAKLGPAFSYSGSQSPEIEARIVQDMVDRGFFRFGYGKLPKDGPVSFVTVWPPDADQTGRPPLYALLGALLAAPFRDAPIDVTVTVLRLFSAVLFAGTVLAIYGAGRHLLPDRPLIALGAALAVGMLPMPAFLGGTVNSDNLANLLAAISFLLVLTGIRKGHSPAVVAGTVVVLILAFLTKRTTAFVWPLVGLVWAIQAWRSGPVARAAVGISAATLLLVGGLGIAGPAPFQQYFATFGKGFLANGSVQQDVQNLLAKDLGMNTVNEIVSRSGPAAFRGTVANYGWSNVKMEPIWYVAAGAVAIASLTGLVLYFATGFRRLPFNGKLQILALTAGLVLAVTTTFLYTIAYAADGTVPQGRYLFVGLAPAALLGTIGVSRLIPARWKERAFLVGVCGVALFDAMAIVSAMLPVYYG